jgi:hypothetical protein
MTKVVSLASLMIRTDMVSSQAKEVCRTQATGRLTFIDNGLTYDASSKKLLAADPMDRYPFPHSPASREIWCNCSKVSSFKMK